MDLPQASLKEIRLSRLAKLVEVLGPETNMSCIFSHR